MLDVTKSKLMVISILVLDTLTQHCKKDIGIIGTLKNTSSLKLFLNVQSLKLVSILTHGTEDIIVQHTIKVIYATSVNKDMLKRTLIHNALIVHLAS